jgi:hypothetical protein
MATLELTEESLREKVFSIVQEALEKELSEKPKKDFIDEFSESIAGRIIRIEQNMATKDDIRNMATKDDIRNMATKDDIIAIREVMATKDDIRNMATKDDIKTERYWMTFIMASLLTIAGLVLKLVGI